MNQNFGQQADERPQTMAQMCLELILVLPEAEDRLRRIKDFYRFYEITERKAT